jgi:hemerythrin-like domain-containing protein
MKSTNSLIQEHKVILRALDVLDAMSAEVEKTGTAPQAGLETILDFMRWFADAHHQAKEETILFPALTKAAASQGRHVEHMAHEHDLDRKLIEQMEKDLRLSNLSEFAAKANQLSSTVRNHIYKEDRMLFETVDQVLSPKEDAEVFQQLEQFDSALDRHLLDEKLKDLRSLEWTYLRRS